METAMNALWSTNGPCSFRPILPMLTALTAFILPLQISR